jgi:hypothetical protein
VSWYGDAALLSLVGDVDGVGRGVGRHEVHPPLHDAVGLGEEAVAADIHAVAVVANGAGDAADLVRGFEDNGLEVCLPEKFKGCGETRWTCSDDDGSLVHLASTEELLHSQMAGKVQLIAWGIEISHAISFGLSG